MQTFFCILTLSEWCRFVSSKELLGHEDLNSTKIYTHTSVNHLENK